MIQIKNTIGHRTTTKKSFLCPFSFLSVHSRHSRHSRHSTETTNDNATQDAEMTRKQHKHTNLLQPHKSRENSREMLSDVSYKSDTMTTNGRVAGVQNIVLNKCTLLHTKAVQRWRGAVAMRWCGEVNICGRKICHSWKIFLTKCVDNNINMMYYKIEARVKNKADFI